jgi:hypothetical protein
MLDTEHIEVRFQLKGTFPELLDVLGRRAETITFHSLGERHNITLYYADGDDAHLLPHDRLPPRSITDGIVKKCRIVEREGDEYAILPICYPSVPVTTENWPSNEADAALLGDGVGRSIRARFYGAALIASLGVLQWVLKSIYAGKPGLVSIYLPTLQRPDTTSRSYSLNHLAVMYPTLKIPALLERISDINRAAETEGFPLRRKPLVSKAAFDEPDAQLRRDAWELLRVIRAILDSRIDEERIFDPSWEIPQPFGLTLQEAFDIGERFGWSKVKVSALFDILIDDGHLVTDVDSEQGDEGQRYAVRVFEPDGEMVSDLVRLFNTQRGLPDGF